MQALLRVQHSGSTRKHAAKDAVLLEDGYSKRKVVLNDPLKKFFVYMMRIAIVGDGGFQRLTLLSVILIVFYESTVLCQLTKASHEQGYVATGVDFELGQYVNLQAKNRSFDYSVYIHVSHLKSLWTLTSLP